MKRVMFTALGWSAGGVIGWLALRRVDWGEAIDGVRQVEWSVIFMAVAAVLFAHYLKAHRWKLLLPGESISAGRLFLMRNVGAGLHAVSPVRGVSEITQLTLLHQRDGIRAPKVVASFVVGHLLDLVVSANMVAIGLVMLPAFAPYRAVVVGVAAGSAVLLLLTPFLAQAVGKIGLVRQRRLVHETLAAIRSAQSSKRTLLACMALTALGWAYIGLAAWMIADAIVRFAGVIPTPPALVGIYEAVAVSALGLFGVAPPLALSFALVTHAVIFVPPVLIGALVLVAERSALVNAFDSLLGPLRHARFRLQPQQAPK